MQDKLLQDQDATTSNDGTLEKEAHDMYFPRGDTFRICMDSAPFEQHVSILYGIFRPFVWLSTCFGYKAFGFDNSKKSLREFGVCNLLFHFVFICIMAILISWHFIGNNWLQIDNIKRLDI